MKVSNRPAVPLLGDWLSIDWKVIESQVWGIQQRIYHAESNGQRRKVRELQRMISRSQSALLLAIRRVTQLNKGKRTAGVDGYRTLTNEDRVELYNKLKDYNVKLHEPLPAKRTYIEKDNNKLRPLGIPTFTDRVYQHIAKLALEPQWEYKFEGSSYGFRPKRGAHDAIANIFNKFGGSSNKQWVFEGDFKGCFDNLSHEHIVEQLGNFPLKELIIKWLKAGYVENDTFNTTDSGTPQGGIISPLLANIALHGMEEELGIKYRKRNGEDSGTVESPFSLVRYADDFVIITSTKSEATEMYDKLKPYLEKRGLELAMDKTKVTHISEGFDFLGFNVKQYNGKLLIKPSKKSIKKAKMKISETFNQLKGKPVDILIGKLNPIIRGYANYWKPVVAKETFSDIDHHVFTLGVKFLKRMHPMKSWKWIKARYYKGDIAGQSRDKWLLTSPTKGNQIIKMSWTPIERYVLIRHRYTPYNKELQDYFAKRDEKLFLKNNVSSRQKLAKKQKFICPMCDRSIINGDEGLELHHMIPKAKGGDNKYNNLQLVHISCHIDHHRKFPVKGRIPTEIMVKASKKSRKAYTS